MFPPHPIRAASHCATFPPPPLKPSSRHGTWHGVGVAVLETPKKGDPFTTPLQWVENYPLSESGGLGPVADPAL
jgi:hypothetical protein